MPRGIPNVKRDDTGLKYTTFHVPLAYVEFRIQISFFLTYSGSIPNMSRQLTSNQIHLVYGLARRSHHPLYQISGKQSTTCVKSTPCGLFDRRGRNVLVIHPGSRNLRIGRASDVNPVTYPSVVARLQSHPVSKPVYIEGITRLSSTHDLNGSNDQVDTFLTYQAR